MAKDIQSSGDTTTAGDQQPASPVSIGSYLEKDVVGVVEPELREVFKRLYRHAGMKTASQWEEVITAQMQKKIT